jgi:hypothetical protein
MGCQAVIAGKPAPTKTEYSQSQMLISPVFDLAVGLGHNQNPLTLALSRRERGLTVVDARDTPP